MNKLPCLILSSLLLAPGMAWAEKSSEEPDEIDEVDEPIDEISRPSEKQVTQEGAALKEVVRGFYVQAILTDRDFLGTVVLNPAYYPIGATSSWGTGLRLGMGYDVVDAPSFGLAVEASYDQGAYNGVSYSRNPQSLIQGDFRIHALNLGLRPSLVLGQSRRWSVFARALGGMFLSEQAISDEAVASSGITGIHGTWKPAFGGGLGVEYYSKLSHFSFTFAEAEFLYVLGFDTALSIDFVGLKYTF